MVRYFVYVLTTITLLATLTLQAAYGNGCGLDDTPSIDDQHGWFCINDQGSDSVLVFIHGYPSNNREAWGASRNAEPTYYWPEIVASDTDISGHDIFLLGYDSSLFSSVTDTKDAVLQAFRRLNTQIGGQKKILDYRTIVFVTHSAGGVVARDILATYSPKFVNKNIGLLLIDSPTNGTYGGYFGFLSKNKVMKQMSGAGGYLTKLQMRFEKMIGDHPFASFVGSELWAPLGVPVFEDVFVKGWDIHSPVFVEEESALYHARIAKTPGFQIGVPVSGTHHSNIAHPLNNTKDTHFALKILLKELRDEQQCGVNDFLVSPTIEFKFNADDEARAKHAVKVRIAGLTDVAGRVSTLKANNGNILARMPVNAICKDQTIKGTVNFIGETKKTTKLARKPAFCFKHNKHTASQTVMLECDENACRITDDQVSLCETENFARADHGWFAAYASDQVNETAEPHWSLSSADTILAMPAHERPGYTQFTIRAGNLPSELNSADSYTAAILVNDIELAFDNEFPRTKYLELNNSGELYHTFYLENLAFSGRYSGHEKITVEFDFFKDRDLVGTAVSTRGYTAYRHLRFPDSDVLKTLRVDQNVEFSWSGRYVPSKAIDRYEVFLTATKFGDNHAYHKSEAEAFQWIKLGQKKIEVLGIEFKGMEVVGRARPPYPETQYSKRNNSFGLVFALRNPQTGQIRSTFTETESKEICDELRDWQNSHDLPKAYISEPYIYDFLPDNFEKGIDRGKYLRSC